MRHLFVIFIILNFVTYAQAQVTAASKINSPTTLDKKDLAKEFFEVAGIKAELNASIQFGEGFLNRPPAEKNPELAAQNKKIYAAAKIKWQKRKETLPEELTQQSLKDIENTFSAPELKYLIEVSKTSVFKKFNLFLRSDSYGKLFNSSTLIARSLVDDSRKELAGSVKVPNKQ